MADYDISWIDVLNVEALIEQIKAGNPNQHHWPYDCIIEDLDYLVEYSKRCQSPIEQILFWALAVKFRFFYDSVDTDWIDMDYPQVSYKDRNQYKVIPFSFYTQRSIRIQNKVYRPDFSFFCDEPPNLTPSLWIHIEADGHEHHDKTKEQAQRDKSRDRMLMSEGNTKVLHYTGSEIYKDVAAVVEDITQHVYKTR